MPTTEERLASLEAGMHRMQDILTGITEIKTAIADLRTELRTEITNVRDEVRNEIRDLRTDTTHQFGDVTRQFGEVNRQFIDMRAEAHRDFKWVVGIQLTTMAGVIAALVGALYRQ